uniref:Uncharacterized protein n=1 Tax=Magallana gigas TaxID=29159 RepID=K1QZI1_MAGGI
MKRLYAVLKAKQNRSKPRWVNKGRNIRKLQSFKPSLSTEIPVGTIIGAVVGGIAGLIFLCVIIVVVCIVCCKKKSTGTWHIIHIHNIHKAGECSQVRHQIQDIAIVISNRIHPRHLHHRQCPRRLSCVPPPECNKVSFNQTFGCLRKSPTRREALLLVGD